MSAAASRSIHRAMGQVGRLVIHLKHGNDARLRPRGNQPPVYSAVFFLPQHLLPRFRVFVGGSHSSFGVGITYAAACGEYREYPWCCLRISEYPPFAFFASQQHGYGGDDDNDLAGVSFVRKKRQAW